MNVAMPIVMNSYCGTFVASDIKDKKNFRFHSSRSKLRNLFHKKKKLFFSNITCYIVGEMLFE